jgi:response regulator RpfG family c-di-GMP phosphodiesterase
MEVSCRESRGFDVGRTRHVLVIDDDELLCALVRTTFEFEDYSVDAAHDVIEAEQFLVGRRPDGIVLDIGLPGIDGLFYLERLRKAASTRSIPVVAVSGSQVAGEGARAAGAAAFLQKPFNPLELLMLVARLTDGRGFGMLEPRRQTVDAGDLHRLIEIGRRQHELLSGAYAQTVATLASALESRDFGTSEHSRRVTTLAARLTLEVAPSLLDDPSLEWGFLLHDVGKIGIPDRILLKPGPLTDAERRQMQQHPLLGEQLLAGVPLLHEQGIQVIRSHHERWDGAGYPDGLSEHAIPLAARIFALVDALDAMTDLRPYRAPLGWDAAVDEIRRSRGSHFDPYLVDGFEACEADLYELHNQGSPHHRSELPERPPPRSATSFPRLSPSSG